MTRLVTRVLLRAALLAGACVAACASPDPFAVVDLRLEVAPDLATRPTSLKVSWLNGERGLFRASVPETGELPTMGALLSTVRVQIAAAGDQQRRVVVEGRAGDRVVGVGAVAFEVKRGQTQQLTIVLTTSSGDRDADGVPDDLDVCPGDDFLGCVREPDGGARPSPSLDGGSTDQAPAAPDAAMLPRDTAGMVVADARPPVQPDAAVPDVMVVPVVLDAATPPPPPPKPVVAPTLKATVVSGKQIDLSWVDTNEEKTMFQVERAGRDGGFSPLLEVAAATITHSDSTVRALETYRYRVRTLKDTTQSPWSTVVMVTTPAVLLDGPRSGTKGLTPETDYLKATDGDVNTYFLGVSGEQNIAFSGVDGGTPHRLTKIRFHPRQGHVDAMVGGTFQGSNGSAYAGFEPIIKITDTPREGWNEINLPADTKSYRWYRYLTASKQAGNVAEIEFWGGPVP